MKIAIISNIGNGIGLQVDYELLRDLLVSLGHEVTGIQYTDQNPPDGFDVAIFLETLPPHMLHIAKQNWAFPNIEWLDPEGERILRQFDRIFAKTHEAYRQLSKRMSGVQYVGFLARDKYDPSVPRKRQVLHVGGNGGYRNTNQVLEAWRSCRYYEGIPEDIPLVVISNSTYYQHEDTPGVVFHKRLDDAEIKRLQNESLYHLYPSSVEGYGHAMHEALSVGATLITTDAPPMNEIKHAVYIPTCGSTPHKCADLYEVNPADIRCAVNTALALPPSIRSRGEFLFGNAEFVRLFSPHLKPKDMVVVCIHGNHNVSYCTEEELVHAFEDLGHRVVSTQENETTTEEILKQCIETNVKLFIYVHTHGWITPGKMDMSELLQKFRKLGITTMGFHLDRYKGLNLGDGRESRVGTPKEPPVRRDPFEEGVTCVTYSFGGDTCWVSLHLNNDEFEEFKMWVKNRKAS
jgi:hypothetical protein